MTIVRQDFHPDFDPRFKTFHELMARKIREVLLISAPYDAWIMEEDCRLSERIVHEYRGLNLSNPPRLHWASTPREAFRALEIKQFDMVIVISHHTEVDIMAVVRDIKKKFPDLPLVLLCQSVMQARTCRLEGDRSSDIDRTFLWIGNTDILLALIKSAEDRLNVAHDTRSAGIRVIIFVEDSPEYMTSLLPILYKELVSQTQAVMEEGLNEEHRLLAMRARPKILLAENYEEAVALYQQYEPYVLGVISDVRYPKAGRLDDQAGIKFLREIKNKHFDVPLLLTSSEPSNADRAAAIPALFIDKNAPSFHSEIRAFFMHHLGFGDFVFRMPDGSEIGRVANLRSLEKRLHVIPEASFVYHCNRNDFSRWLFARSEIELASIVRPIRDEDFQSVESHRRYLISIIHARRMRRQKGVIVNFEAGDFDLDTEFFKIGKGSIGGKARGLAFLSSYMARHPAVLKAYGHVDIFIPQTLIITTEGFDDFIEQNAIWSQLSFKMSDDEIARLFLDADFPEWIVKDLRSFLAHIRYPLAVRSSSLLEDAQFRAYAGLYKTYMLANDDPDLDCRLHQLIDAIKLVYASTYFKAPRDFSRRVGHRTEEEKMAVMVQRVIGQSHGDFYYPAISGVAQSYNYYPFSQMKPEEGAVTIALGLGKTVMDGEAALRFSPQHPEILPQRSTVDDILENAQRAFYGLRLNEPCIQLDVNDSSTLEKCDVYDMRRHYPVRFLSSTYLPDDHRIRDSAAVDGYPVLTFSSVIKYHLFPLAEIVADVLRLGKEGLGCSVEMEFSADIHENTDHKPTFAILQLRPMTARAELTKVDIGAPEIERAFCHSTKALGNAVKKDIADIVFVKPDVFDAARTREIAHEIGEINARLMEENRKYLLIGPGRWGSADRWLGIPVNWSDICGVDAIVEVSHPELKADPSQGSHFFHNITSLGINYITISSNRLDTMKWEWLQSLPRSRETRFVAHVRLARPLLLKVDGRESRCVILA